MTSDGLSRGSNRDFKRRSDIIRPGYVGSRTFWLVLFAGFIALAGLLRIRASFAIGPTLPLAFEDLPEIKDPWTVVLRVDSQQIRVNRVERYIYASGERLRVEPFDPKFEEQVIDERVESRARIPLLFKGIEDLKQRSFAQKITVEGQWLKEQAAKPLHLERWFYFIAEGDKIRRVDLEEYSNFTDRAEVGVDSRGRQGVFNPGRDLKTAVPLSETKSTPAIPVGPSGGAAEELPARKGKRVIPETDRSEVDEK